MPKIKKSIYLKSVDTAYIYGNNRVKRFSKLVMASIGEDNPIGLPPKLFSIDDIANKIQSALLIDAITTITEQQSGDLPSNLTDSAF
jgi:hypothetical protein